MSISLVTSVTPRSGLWQRRFSRTATIALTRYFWFDKLESGFYINNFIGRTDCSDSSRCRCVNYIPIKCSLNIFCVVYSDTSLLNFYFINWISNVPSSILNLLRLFCLWFCVYFLSIKKEPRWCTCDEECCFIFVHLTFLHRVIWPNLVNNYFRIELINKLIKSRKISSAC